MSPASADTFQDRHAVGEVVNQCCKDGEHLLAVSHCRILLGRGNIGLHPLYEKCE